MIARLVAQRLRTFDVKILAYDPFVTAEQAQELGVTLCSLQELFSRSDVVSLHTPWLKETENMITGEMFASMKQGATFINSARGAVIREPEMIEVLQRRPDLQAVLDVTYPEPPAQDSPLWTMETSCSLRISPAVWAMSATAMPRPCSRSVCGI
ncbi:MAG: NAD(P)-dependent oxidoreductase [Oscillospiraceae bacterium]